MTNSHDFQSETTQFRASFAAVTATVWCILDLFFCIYPVSISSLATIYYPAACTACPLVSPKLLPSLPTISRSRSNMNFCVGFHPNNFFATIALALGFIPQRYEPWDTSLSASSGVTFSISGGNEPLLVHILRNDLSHISANKAPVLRKVMLLRPHVAFPPPFTASSTRRRHTLLGSCTCTMVHRFCPPSTWNPSHASASPSPTHTPGCSSDYPARAQAHRSSAGTQSPS